MTVPYAGGSSGTAQAIANRQAPTTGAGRSALAPRRHGRINLATLLGEALHPGQDDPDRRSIRDIMHGLEELHERRERYEVADDNYQGSVGLTFASQRVQQLLSRSGVEDIPDFNYAAIIVDRIAARLQVSSMVAGPADENDDAAQKTEDAAAEAANKIIAELVKVNELDAELKRLWAEVSRYGEAYVMVWPGETDDGRPTVDIRVNSPHHVIMIYDEEDPLRPRYALKSWTSGSARNEVTRANLYYPDRIERWSTEPNSSPDQEDSWHRLEEAIDFDLDPDEDESEEDELAELAADEFTDPDGVALGNEDVDLLGRPNEWGRVPWFHFRNDRPEGHPEHERAYGPQIVINKLIYALAGVIDYMAFPQRYVLMDPMNDDPMQNMSDPAHPDLEDDDVEDEGGTAGLDSSPSSVWKLWGASVGQFQVADAQGFLAVLDRIVRSMAELTGLPVDAFSRDSASIPSGESRREANADFVAICQDRIDRYDPILQDALEFALRILGITNVSVDVRWKPLQMINDLGGWQVVQAKINAGVPPKVALEEAGYAPEQVDEWLKDATGADLGRRIALLNQIATAVQAFGAAVATGAMSAKQTQAIVEAMLGLTVAGTDPQIVIPHADDLVDPTKQAPAALQADALAHRADMQQADFQHAAEQQQAAREHATAAQQTGLQHATATQQASQDFQAEQAVAAHERAKEMFGQGHDNAGPGGPNDRRQSGRQDGRPGRRTGRTPSGGRR